MRSIPHSPSHMKAPPPHRGKGSHFTARERERAMILSPCVFLQRSFHLRYLSGCINAAQIHTCANLEYKPGKLFRMRPWWSDGIYFLHHALHMGSFPFRSII